jgi:peroxidase
MCHVFRHVDDIDLYMGGISERSVSNGVVGATFACLIANQFNDLRRGDRFFYSSENQPSPFTAGRQTEFMCSIVRFAIHLFL